MTIKLAVKTSVPAKSSGRLLDALTDLIRPFSERRGLRADQIRLQREEVLIKIAQKALERTKLEKGVIRAIPNKGLIPLLEKASLEDPRDKTMVDLWANLLASAAIGQRHNLPRYVTILSEINGRQARLLQNIMIGNSTSKQRDGERLLDGLWSTDRESILLTLQQEVETPLSRDRRDDHVELLSNCVVRALSMDGVALSDVIVNDGSDQWDITHRGRRNRPFLDFVKHQLDIDTLESLNLLKDRTFKYLSYHGFEISAFYYVVTPLAVDLFSSCNPHLIKRRARDIGLKARSDAEV